MSPFFSELHHNTNPFTHFLQSTTFFPPKPKPKPPPSHLFLPLCFPFSGPHPDPPAQSPSPFSGPPGFAKVGGAKRSGPTQTQSGGGNGNGGPVFVGQVFSMCDATGTGLMTVSNQSHLPFLFQRMPEWMKKIFSAIAKNDSGPVFHFFVDLGDAVSYVKRLRAGVVGACRLNLAYEHFKEKPHLFQFVPNSKQVKAASRLLKGCKGKGRNKISGVPVFSAQNLDIAIATPEGIKWYTPYFFDKNILDSILEESVDQHFHDLIQSRYVQRRRDVMDDSLPAEVIEESMESVWEPAEVQELMDEIGPSEIPLSVISKAAEMQLLYTVDKTLLGNRWLRKATGIQPKFPYVVDSFERRSAVSRSRACMSEIGCKSELPEHCRGRKPETDNQVRPVLQQQPDLRFPLGDWLRLPWSKVQESDRQAETRALDPSGGYVIEELQNNSLLPKITMIGFATSEPGQMSKATIKKTIEDLSKELEQDGHAKPEAKCSTDKSHDEERDPLFVANVGDYYTNTGKKSSPRWIRGVQR